MKLYLFGIGGSGARVIKSFIHLLASGANVPNNTEIVPVIIDTDAQSHDTVLLNRIITSYNRVQKVVYNNQGETAGLEYFKTNISPRQFNFQTLNLDVTFNEFLNNYQGQNNELSDDYKLLMDSLYDSSPRTSSSTELNLELRVGFKGNPNVGGIIFNMLSHEQEFLDLLRVIRAEDRIFIVSSIFGGNGSSGFPALMNLFQNNDFADIQAAKKGALTVLPYYEVDTPIEGGAINSKMFNSKSKSALSFYAKDPVLNSLQAHYYISDGLRGLYSYSEGGNESGGQENEANIVEFLGAASIVDFLNKSDAELNNNSKYGFGLNMIGNANVQENQHGDNVIHIGHLRNIDNIKKNIINPLTKFAFMKRYFDYLLDDRSSQRTLQVDAGFYNDNTDSYKNVLIEYYSIWQEWMNELQERENGKRALRLYNLNTNLDDLIYEGGQRLSKKYDSRTSGMLETIFTNSKNINHTPLRFFKSLSDVGNDFYNLATEIEPTIN